MAKVGRRRAPSRRARKALIVCTEGETERDYFEGLRKALHVPKDLLCVVNDKGTSVVNLAGYLKRVRMGRVRDLPDVTFDQMWGVADTEWSGSWKSVASRTSEEDAFGRGPNLLLWALSSSSFERWLLLHFEDNPPCLDARASARRVGRFLGGYGPEAKRLPQHTLDRLLPLTDVALARAQRWRELHETEDNFTDVDLLVRVIMRDVAETASVASRDHGAC